MRSSKTVFFVIFLTLLSPFSFSSPEIQGIFPGIQIPFLSSPKRKWERHTIEGAYCGSGLPYSVFISKGSSKKIAFYFMGGGACWNTKTCYGPTPMTILYPLPTVVEFSGLLSPKKEHSPIYDHTVVFFPYCTGDVHLGDHIAHYGPLGSVPVHHEGKLNIEKSLDYLINDAHLVHPEKVKKIVGYGYSAGAIGLLYHSLTLDSYFPNVPDRSLVIDSPGLHFGSDFWDKFSDELLDNFRSRLSEIGYHMRRGNGNIARVIPRLCETLPDWRVGVLQGSRDIVMATIFGSISMKDHEKLIYGPTGLKALTKNTGPSCTSWVPQSKIHTFLVTDFTSQVILNKTTALQYSAEVIE